MEVSKEPTPEVERDGAIGPMDLILREAQDQHLMDTELLARIWVPAEARTQT
jgi:hypothetical protein